MWMHSSQCWWSALRGDRCGQCRSSMCHQRRVDWTAEAIDSQDFSPPRHCHRSSEQTTLHVTSWRQSQEVPPHDKHIPQCMHQNINGNINKKAQLTRGLRATAAHVWRPQGQKSKISRKPLPSTKYHVDRQTGCEVIAIFVYPTWPSAAMLDFWHSKVASLDRLTLKTPP